MLTFDFLDELRKKCEADNVQLVRGSIIGNLLNQQKRFNRNHDAVYAGQEHPAFIQGKTGYCWLTSLLFCLSQYENRTPSGHKQISSKSYLIFYDKLEKANCFLNFFADGTSSEPQGREFHYLLENPMTDRGQWAMGVNLIQKYGVIPYEAMPDDSEKTGSGELNACLSLILRCAAVKLRKCEKKREPVLAERKRVLQSIYNLLVSVYGYPPQNLSRPVNFPFESYISICCTGHPLDINYEIAMDGNVAEGMKNRFLSVSNSVFEDAIICQVEREHFCWVTCDAGKFYLKKDGIWDDSLFDLKPYIGDLGYDGMTREERFQGHIASMTHAMVLCGRQDGYWIVKNSSDRESNTGSYCALSERWFHRYVFQAVVNKAFLPDAVLKSVKNIQQVMPWEFFNGEMRR